MPSLISDAVDAYVVRRLNARLQFLLLQRRADAPFGSSWQAIHARVAPEETAIIAAERALCGDVRVLLLEPSIAQTMSTRFSITRAMPSS